MAWLRDPGSSVAGVRYAVCGLGDTTYPYFAQAGRDFDHLLAARGGHRVLQRHDCDVDFEEPFAAFTAAVLDQLSATGEAPRAARPTSPGAEPVPSPRRAPAQATLVSRRLLSGPGSSKETMHYRLRWSGAPVAYTPGDCFALHPQNNPVEVETILRRLELNGATPVQVSGDSLPLSLRETLLDRRDLHRVTPRLMTALTGAPAPEEALRELHLLDVLLDHPRARIRPQSLVDNLSALRPRLYSVASSPLALEEGVELTVETLRYRHSGWPREGVASTWLADRVAVGDTVSLSCVRGPHFRLPEDGGVPIIMIGRGPGSRRSARSCSTAAPWARPGRSWLFFGHQHRGEDFLYRDELRGFLSDGTLTELSLAWSRDQAEKIYVQHRIRERGAEVWSWLAAGACVYVCGDKRAMAPQVRGGAPRRRCRPRRACRRSGPRRRSGRGSAPGATASTSTDSAARLPAEHGLEVERAARPLHAEEVVEVGVREVVHLGAGAQLPLPDGAHEGEREAVGELGGHLLLGVGEAQALPAPVEGMHVARGPAQAQPIPAGGQI